MVALRCLTTVTSPTCLHPPPLGLNQCLNSFYYPPKLNQFTISALVRYPQNLLKFTSCVSSSSSSKFSSSMEDPPEGYRRNVGICLINSSNKIFTALRLNVPGAWQMPQGGVDEGEDPKTAAIRELREETGVTSADVLSEVPYWLTYDFPPVVKEKLNKQWGSDWKGQTQKWFLFRFTGNDEEINLLGDGTEKPEFGEWSWLTPQQVTELVVDFKKPVYEEVLKFFTPHLQSDLAASL